MTIRVHTIEIYRYQAAALKRGMRIFYADAAQEIRTARIRKSRARGVAR